MPDGERTNGTAATEHTAGAGAEGKRRASGGKAGREGGEKGADGHAPGEWRRQEERHGEEHGRTDGNRERREKEIYKYLRERREKNAAETRKSVQVCAYTFYLISRRVGCLLHFLLYI